MPSESRLFLLDAYALIYRAYYALMRSPRVTSAGMNTSAIFGFVNTLDEVLRKENPTHIAVCFDPPGGHTFRHELYPEYKAGRDKQPEDITIAIPYIKRILEAYRIPAVEVEGYEADDVIGTLSREAEREGFVTYMMTPDKDYGQLVTDRVLMFRPALRGQGFEIRGPQQVAERYGIERPAQVIDLLALEGDKSDNIPGCPGIGEKTAAALIRQWGSVENLIANVDQLKGATQRRIADNASQILFSRELATIRTDVPLPDDLTPRHLERRTPDYDALRQIYTELEFRTFIARLPQSESASATPAQAPAAPRQGDTASLFDFDYSETPAQADTPVCDLPDTDYTVATTPAELTRLLGEAPPADGTVAIAFTATGPTPMQMELTSVAVATAPGRVIFAPTPAPIRKEMIEALRPLIDDPDITVVCHDVKTLLVILSRFGINLTAPYYDTAVAHYLIDPEINHRLSTIAAKYLGCRLTDPAELTATERARAMSAPDATTVCALADVTLRIKPLLSAELRRLELDTLFRDIELPMVSVLASMELTGVRINVHELHNLSRLYTERLRRIEEQVYEIAGERFNIGSPAQVGEVLFEKLRIDPKAKKTKRGAYSTTEEILEKYAHKHPICRLILDFRGLRKLLATYIDALPALVNPTTGKIHTTYNQTVTATGRISSTNPNLQNIPVRTDDGREIRRAFIPDPGCLMLSADYSQIELRLIADISGDHNMIEAFASGADIHRATAAKIYHLPLDQTSDTLRRNAKTANFGIIYGISAFGLSERLGIPRGEAKELIDGYFAAYPDIRRYIDRSIEQAREKGYVATIMGRRRPLPDINSRSATVRSYAERNAVNAPLQGSAADIIKKAMIDIDAEIRRLGLASCMIMQVHDELIFNVVPDELPRLQELVVRLMEGAYSGHVRLEVSFGVGANWLEAH